MVALGSSLSEAQFTAGARLPNAHAHAPSHPAQPALAGRLGKLRPPEGELGGRHGPLKSLESAARSPRHTARVPPPALPPAAATPCLGLSFPIDHPWLFHCSEGRKAQRKPRTWVASDVPEAGGERRTPKVQNPVICSVINGVIIIINIVTVVAIIQEIIICFNSGAGGPGLMLPGISRLREDPVHLPQAPPGPEAAGSTRRGAGARVPPVLVPPAPLRPCACPALTPAMAPLYPTRKSRFPRLDA